MRASKFHGRATRGPRVNGWGSRSEKCPPAASRRQPKTTGEAGKRKQKGESTARTKTILPHSATTKIIYGAPEANAFLSGRSHGSDLDPKQPHCEKRKKRSEQATPSRRNPARPHRKGKPDDPPREDTTGKRTAH